MLKIETRLSAYGSETAFSHAHLRLEIENDPSIRPLWSARFLSHSTKQDELLEVHQLSYQLVPLMTSEVVRIRYEICQLELLELPFPPLVLFEIDLEFGHASAVVQEIERTCFGRLDFGAGEVEGVQLQVLDGACAASPNVVSPVSLGEDCQSLCASLLLQTMSEAYSGGRRNRCILAFSFEFCSIFWGSLPSIAVLLMPGDFRDILLTMHAVVCAVKVNKWSRSQGYKSIPFFGWDSLDRLV